MKPSRSKALASMIAITAVAATALCLLPLGESQAAADKQLSAPITAVIQVPNPVGRVFRFEDPEYKVACYRSENGGYLSCVKK